MVIGGDILGEWLYVICPEDGDYICCGKELEVYANHVDAVAVLMFILYKLETFKTIIVRRFGIHESDEKIMKNDCTKEYLAEAKEQIST